MDSLPASCFLDRELQLVLAECHSAATSRWGVPSLIFEMRDHQTARRIGRLSFRISSIDTIVNYTGHIGYSVDQTYRGRHCAERGCRMILPVARAYGISELWITCSPDNIPSRRTIERLGAEYVETVDVPRDYPLDEGAIRQKRRYRLALA